MQNEHGAYYFFFDVADLPPIKGRDLMENKRKDKKYKMGHSIMISLSFFRTSVSRALTQVMR